MVPQSPGGGPHAPLSGSFSIGEPETGWWEKGKSPGRRGAAVGWVVLCSGLVGSQDPGFCGLAEPVHTLPHEGDPSGGQVGSRGLVACAAPRPRLVAATDSSVSVPEQEGPRWGGRRTGVEPPGPGWVTWCLQVPGDFGPLGRGLLDSVLEHSSTQKTPTPGTR